MNKSNICYCILTVQYVKRYCVAGYLLVIIIIIYDIDANVDVVQLPEFLVGVCQ